MEKGSLNCVGTKRLPDQALVVVGIPSPCYPSSPTVSGQEKGISGFPGHHSSFGYDFLPGSDVPGQGKKFSSPAKKNSKSIPFAGGVLLTLCSQSWKEGAYVRCLLLLDWRSENSGLPFSVWWEIKGILALCCFFFSSNARTLKQFAFFLSPLRDLLLVASYIVYMASACV